MLGQCFTISTERQFKSGDSVKLVFHKDGPEPLIIIHDEGSDFWIRTDYWPDEVEKEDFDEATKCLLEPKAKIFLCCTSLI